MKGLSYRHVRGSRNVSHGCYVKKFFIFAPAEVPSTHFKRISSFQAINVETAIFAHGNGFLINFIPGSFFLSHRRCKIKKVMEGMHRCICNKT